MSDRPVDPTGKRALFDPAAAVPGPVVPPPSQEGRAALFSMPARRPGTVVVECSGCRTRTRSSLVDLGRRLASGSAWWPLRRYQHWMACPACGQRTWCRIGWHE